MGKLEDIAAGVKFGFSSTAPRIDPKKSPRKRMIEVSDLYRARVDQMNDNEKSIPPYPFEDYKQEFDQKRK